MKVKIYENIQINTIFNISFENPLRLESYEVKTYI